MNTDPVSCRDCGFGPCQCDNYGPPRIGGVIVDRRTGKPVRPLLEES